MKYGYLQLGEINICKDCIKSYERDIKMFEQKLGIKDSEVRDYMLKDEQKKLYKKSCALEKKHLKDWRNF